MYALLKIAFPTPPLLFYALRYICACLRQLWKWYLVDSCISCGNGLLQIPASAVEMPGHMMPQLDVQFGVDFGSDSNQFGFGSSGDTNSSYTSSSPPTKSVSSCSSSLHPTPAHFFLTHKIGLFQLCALLLSILLLLISFPPTKSVSHYSSSVYPTPTCLDLTLGLLLHLLSI